METKYFIVSNKQKKADQEQAGALLYEINSGAVIISSVPAGDSVHYIVGKVDNYPQYPGVMHPELTDDDAQVIRDNLDATHGDKSGE